MQKLSIEEIISRIDKEIEFSCVSYDNSFTLHIAEYVPYVCAAIHNGDGFRKELESKTLLSKEERWYEEDPSTADFISALPIRIIGNDSRYEYDLNRDPKTCVYETAWGKEIWKTPLSALEKKKSIKKHADFYKVVDALIRKLQRKFKACVVYDIHSYNYKRIIEKDPPMFNVGTANVDSKFKSHINDWLKRLEVLRSDYFVNQTRENDVFQGHGYFLKHISKKYKNTLVLATEVRKSYCDEETGEIYPEVVEELKIGFKKAIISNAKKFIEAKANITYAKRAHLLASDVEPIAKKVDARLYKLLRTFDILQYVNPKNLQAEKKKFFRSKFKKNPNFLYKPLSLDINLFKRKLYDIPVDQIGDVSLKKIYLGVLEAHADQVELLNYRGDMKFRYLSLKYFGEPDKNEIAISNYLLSSPDREESYEKASDELALKELGEEVRHYGFSGKIVLSSNIPAGALFIPSKNQLVVKKGAGIDVNYLKALKHHEIGVHMLTTENAQRQDLKVLRLGLPLNTMTQEGLAILSEYQSGHFSLERLKEIALRTVAIKHMLKENDFSETFHYLIDTFRISEDKSFYITTRVYRGGGFTKDYLYLRGFIQVKKMVDSGKDITPLYVGKTSLDYLPELKELIDRDIIYKPSFTPRSLSMKKEKDEVIEYLLSGLYSKLL